MWFWPLLLACAPPEDPRAAWLVDALVRDNLAWSTREPSVVAAKYARMAADPYDLMRGTAGVYLRDQSRPGTGRAPTAFLRVAEAAGTLIAGDPHPENFGTFVRADGAWLVDLNDLDAAQHGPWLWDLRRAAVGLGMIGAAADCVQPCAADAARALGRAYAAQVAVRAEGGAPLDVADRFGHGAWLASLVARTEAMPPLIDEVAPSNRFGRRLLRTEGLDEAGRGVSDLSPPESELLAALLAAWSGRPPEFRLLDAVRRFGVGVASLPALRFGVLWDRGDDGPEDDALVQLREVVDPPAAPGLVRPVGALYASGPDRINAATRALWFDPQADPELAGVELGPMSFKVVGWTEDQDGFEHVDLAERLAATLPDDGPLLELARFIGGRLADAHADARSADAALGVFAVAADLAGRGDELGEELADGAPDDVQTVLDDLARLRDALDRYGPLLGADAALARGSAP